MPRKKERKSEKGIFSADVMKRAVSEVINHGKSVRAVSQDLNINRTTLGRYVKDARDAPNNEICYKKSHVTKQVFTDNDEQELEEYLIRCSKMFHGLSLKETRRLVFTLAEKNEKNFPESWQINQIAGEDWLYGFLDRRKTLSLRTPESTTIARATSFNKYNVNLSFDNLESVLQQFTGLEPRQVWNLDETGIKTTQGQAMDNHESHVSIDVVEMAWENGLHIVTFPPHCSHCMQPLDVSIYGPFKAFYNSGCSSWMLTHPGVPLTIYDLASLSSFAYQKAFSISNITAGFSSSGIFPLNRNIFPDDAFMPSDVTDREQLVLDIPIIENEPSTSSSQPEISTIAPLQTIDSDQESSLLVSPKDVRPYPKAKPRQNNKRRCSKKSRVITSTPEKNKTLAEKLEREKKSNLLAKKETRMDRYYSRR